MAHDWTVRVRFENGQGHYQDTSFDFTVDNFGGVPAVGDVVLPPRNAARPQNDRAWQVVKRYFKLHPFHLGYVILVVRERARLADEVDMDRDDPLAET